MSFTAEGWAWEQECPSSAAKLVLVCLSWFANKEGGRAFPSIPTICRMTQLADNTVRKALSELIRAALIEKHERKSRNGGCLSSEYRLILREAPPADLRGGTTSDLRGEAPSRIYDHPPSDSPMPPPQNCGDPPPKIARESTHESKTQNQARNHSTTRAKRAREDEHPRFREFYDHYPRKDTGPNPVIRAFNRAIQHGATADEIIEGLKRYRFKDDPQYHPMATTWLNQQRWLAKTPDPAPRPKFRNGFLQSAWNDLEHGPPSDGPTQPPALGRCA